MRRIPSRIFRRRERRRLGKPRRSRLEMRGPGSSTKGSAACRREHRKRASTGTVTAFDYRMLSHLLTVDLDNVAEHSPVVASDLESLVDILMPALGATSARATFFVPRTVALAASSVLRRITDSGHELSCLTTTRLAGLPPYWAPVRDELASTRQAIEDATGRRVIGHRAAQFDLGSSSDWVFDVLIDEGFDYDSSQRPRRAGRGQAGVPASAHAVRRWAGTLLEIPAMPTTVSIQWLPLVLSRQVIKRQERRGGPAMLHLRQSEMVESESRSKQSGRRARRVARRVGGLLGQFQFTSVAQTLSALSRSAPVIEA
jgi:hypothetical protein